MKCPNCRALIDDGVERCTFCGHYFKGSMMEDYKLDNYDPTADYKPAPTIAQGTETQKSKFRLRFKKG
jgi:hypothetical protein